MSSLFLSSVYERGHVNALPDNTRNILYYLDIEVTKILHSNVASQVAPHMGVFQTNHWNIHSVPFILKRQTRCSNSHIFVCVCSILPDKIAEALYRSLVRNSLIHPSRTCNEKTENPCKIP
jgi:hypothetical protein